LELNKFGNRFCIIPKELTIKHLTQLVISFKVKPFKNVKRTCLSNPQVTMPMTTKKIKQAKLRKKEVIRMLKTMVMTLLMLMNIKKIKMMEISLMT